MQKSAQTAIWKKRISAYIESKQSVHQWACENNLSVASVQYWKRRFQKEEPNKPLFVELVDSNISSGVSLVINKTQIILEKEFDSATLIACICALRTVPCSP